MIVPPPPYSTSNVVKTWRSGLRLFLLRRRPRISATNAAVGKRESGIQVFSPMRGSWICEGNIIIEMASQTTTSGTQACAMGFASFVFVPDARSRTLCRALSSFPNSTDSSTCFVAFSRLPHRLHFPFAYYFAAHFAVAASADRPRCRHRRVGVRSLSFAPSVSAISAPTVGIDGRGGRSRRTRRGSLGLSPFL